MKIKKTLIAFTLLFLYTKSTYAFSYNILIPNNYEFTGKDYLGENIQAQSNQGYIFSLGVSNIGFGYESYETKLKSVSNEIKFSSNIYHISYGASGDKIIDKGLLKYLGLGFGFGNSLLECTYCSTYFHKAFTMQYIFLLNLPLNDFFSLKASYNMQTTKVRHKTRTARDDFSANIINFGIGF